MISVRNVGLVAVLGTAALLPGSCMGKSVSLNKANFEELTKGKTVFIKFFAPWCDHCKKLEPEWERLANEWDNHPQGLVGEVDCSDKLNEDWCADTIEIIGLPTIKFGDTSFGGIFLEQWTGDHVYAALSKFAEETLTKPSCSPGSLDGCKPDVRQQYDEFLKLSTPSLDERIENDEKEINDAEESFRAAFDSLQRVYDERSQANEALVAKIKGDLKMLNAVKEHRKP